MLGNARLQQRCEIKVSQGANASVGLSGKMHGHRLFAGPRVGRGALNFGRRLSLTRAGGAGFRLREPAGAGFRFAIARTPGPVSRLRGTPFVPFRKVFATNAVAPSEMCVAGVIPEMCVFLNR